MSRSRRKTPIIGLSGNRSPGQKLFKKQEHSRERSAVKQKLKQGQYENLPSPKQFGNEWDSPRDGKTYFGGAPNMAFYWWMANESIEEFVQEQLEHLEKCMRK